MKKNGRWMGGSSNTNQYLEDDRVDSRPVAGSASTWSTCGVIGVSGGVLTAMGPILGKLMY